MKSMKWLFKRLVHIKSIKWMLKTHIAAHFVSCVCLLPLSNSKCNASNIFALTWQRVRVSLVLWIYLVLANCAVSK